MSGNNWYGDENAFNLNQLLFPTAVCSRVDDIHLPNGSQSERAASETATTAHR